MYCIPSCMDNIANKFTSVQTKTQLMKTFPHNHLKVQACCSLQLGQYSTKQLLMDLSANGIQLTVN